MKLCFPIHQSRTVFSSLGMFKISISENPLSYHNPQSLLSPHFSGSWHYCWLFFRFMTPIVGKLFCPISFIYFLWASCPFASIVDTTVPPTSNFLALLPMCFCCSDTGWCKLLCQQLYCWSMAHCSSLLSHAGRSSKTSIMAEGSSLTWCSVSSTVHKLSLSLQHISSHQFTPVHTSLLLYSPVTAFYWTENSSTRLGAHQTAALLLTRYLILDTQLTFAADVNLKSHSTGGKEFGSTLQKYTHTPLTQQIYAYKFILKLKCPKYKYPHQQGSSLTLL